jgi:hypothetical protein
LLFLEDLKRVQSVNVQDFITGKQRIFAKDFNFGFVD